MMAFKIICFAILGAILGLVSFYAMSHIVVMALGTIWQPLGIDDIAPVAPIYVGLITTVTGLPIGAYFGATLAMWSRGYSFGDYYRSIRDFFVNT
jgi:hypothetical protein